jgi:glutathione synthase/RimK-type ligase-like ATP-grasp enzyme
MKTVLIITSRSEKTVAWQEREKYVRAFCEQLEKKTDNVKVIYTTYPELEYKVVNGKVSIYDSLNKLSLSDVDFVHFKNWQYELGEAPVVADYLKSKHIIFFNSEVNVPIAPGKLAQMFKLALQEIPVPDTYYTSKYRLSKMFDADKLPDGFLYPLIMKANDGSRGDDNHLIKDSKEAIEVLSASDIEKNYVLQNFIPNDGDYRILFIGLDETPIVFLRTSSDGGHLNNTSKGGTGKDLEVFDVPEYFIDYARRSASILQREIGGVDIIVYKNTNKPYVLEVNGTPAIATGHGINKKNSAFAHFLEKQLQIPKTEPISKQVIGRADRLSFPEAEVFDLPAKIDSGAYRSSIWATDIEEKDDLLYFKLLGPESPFYSAKELSTSDYRLVEVENSFGQKEVRYSVFLSVQIAGRKIRSNFTLANRGSKTYAALIGRKMLKNRFIVDVSVGQPLEDEEVNGDESLV